MSENEEMNKPGTKPAGADVQQEANLSDDAKKAAAEAPVNGEEKVAAEAPEDAAKGSSVIPSTSEALQMRNVAAEADTKAAEQLIPDIKTDIIKAKADVPKTSIGKIIFMLIVGALILAVILRIVQLQGQVEETETVALTNVTTQSVEKGSIEVTSPLSGRISAKDSVNVIPMVAGEVTAVYVKEHTYVKAGQTLFTMDSKQAQRSYEQAELTVKAAEDGIATLNKTLTRLRTLYDAGTVSKSDVEAVEDQITSSENQLEQAKINVQSAQDALGYYTVTAPSGGYVTAVNVTVGGPASQASPAVTLTDTSVLELSANMSEYMITNIKRGDTVDVYIKSVSEEPFKGTISEIQEMPNTGTYTYPIKITISDSSKKLKAGMFAEVRFASAKKNGVLIVPSDAVITKDGAKYAVLLNSDDTVKLKAVEIGIDNGTIAEVTSGLSEGTTIVVKGQTYIEDGEKVNVVK